MRTRRELKAMFPDPRMRELIDSLWREIHDNHVIEDVFQLAHGFEPGEAVKIDPQSGLWVRSMADTSDHAGTIGLVCRINDPDSFNIRIGGLLVGEYEIGANYFLSPISSGELFIQTDPEVWSLGNVREFIGTGVEGGLMIELDLGEEITEQEIFIQVQSDWSQTDQTKKDYIKNKPSFFNNSVQKLSGSAPVWNANLGMNATILLSASTSISLSGLQEGQSGNLTVTNAPGTYTLTFAGYGNKISPAIYLGINQVKTSGESKTDVFSWYYDGSVLIWNGTNDYK